MHDQPAAVTDRRRLRPWWFIALSGAVLLCAGGVGGWLIAVPASPESLAAPTGVTEVPLAPESFADERTVMVSVTAADGADLLASADGVVTSVDCQPGMAWDSGTTPVSVDGAPLVVLATSMPLWRDLREGDYGADVAALQTELRRLGVDTAVDGSLTPASWSAVKSFFTGKGMHVDDGTLRRAEVVWAPGPSVAIGSCAVQVGQRIADGGAIAQIAPRLSGLAVSPMPADLADGTRTVTVGGATVPTDESGAVTDPDDLARLGREQQISAALLDPQRSQLAANLALAEPVTVYSLPAGAVSGLGADACVATATGAVPATIVSSTLGRTLVAFRAGDAPTEALIDPERPATCG